MKGVLPTRASLETRDEPGASKNTATPDFRTRQMHPTADEENREWPFRTDNVNVASPSMGAIFGLSLRLLAINALAWGTIVGPARDLPAQC
jgi:hypothetical protein